MKSKRKEKGINMYRIQAFNRETQRFNVHFCRYMEEREAYINGLIESGNYSRAGISWEWLARM